MKKFLNFSFVLLGSLSLIGCSYFETDQDLTLDSTPPVEVIDLTNAAPDDMGDVSDGTIQPQRFEPAPPVEDVIAQSTDGSVEVYMPGSPAGASAGAHSYGDMEAMPVDTVSAVPVGGDRPMIYSMDPSVEVFPLDGPVVGQTGLPQPSGPPTPIDKLNIVNENTGGKAAVYFDRSQTRLDSEGTAQVSALAAQHEIARGIAVEGYASTESSIEDPVQRKIANLKVSMERAFSVARVLIEKGVPAELITTIAYGEVRPAATAAESRRVEIRGLSGQ